MKSQLLGGIAHTYVHGPTSLFIGKLWYDSVDYSKRKKGHEVGRKMYWWHYEGAEGGDGVVDMIKVHCLHVWKFSKNKTNTFKVISFNVFKVNTWWGTFFILWETGPVWSVTVWVPRENHQPTQLLLSCSGAPHLEVELPVPVPWDFSLTINNNRGILWSYLGIIWLEPPPIFTCSSSSTYF